MKTAKCKTTHYACDCVYERWMLLEKVAHAAENLWDNRLGHRPGNPVWHSLKDIWIPLGEALSALREREGR